MRILCLADIHIGAVRDTKYVYDVMSDIINKEILLTTTDAVIILGDYFDKLFRANDIYVSLAINVMSSLVRACQKKHTKIRLIYGTESHENSQYNLFNHHFTTQKVDIKLITTCTEEELFPGCNVLYVPEEYITDKHEFYKDTIYSGKHYDYIFGHGIIVDGMPPVIGYTKSNSNEKQVPRFNSGELAACSKLTIFGHYHKFTNIGNNVYYLGSLFRWSFGEEEPKGYGVITDGRLEFIENDKAYVYKTYNYDDSSEVYYSTDALVKEIDRIKNENQELFNGEKVGKIRLIFHPGSDVDPSFKENLKTILFNDKIIQSLVKEDNMLFVEDSSDIDDEWAFILDTSMPICDKIYKFISKQYDDVMSLKELTNYIENPLKM